MAQELTITRIIDAPHELVFKAWTDPELLKQWWGAEGFTCPMAEIDLKIGGKYFADMRSTEGNDVYSTGTFVELDPPHKIVLTDSFADEKGNVVPATHYGMSGDFPLEMRISVTLDDIDGRTRLTLVHGPVDSIPESDLSLMETGWDQMFDKLAETLDARRRRHERRAA